jgi:DNA-directed RNA polymerase subunit E'
MYLLSTKEKVVRIPPEMLGEDLTDVINQLSWDSFESKIEGSDSLTVLVINVEQVGLGRIVHGDGAIYQKVKFDALEFRPQLQEIIEGTVVEVLKFGAFVRFGPLDGLLHISQIMDDRIDVDADNGRLIGKDTKRDLKVGDKVRARIVALSLNERSPRESKIGLTMRQPGLGKLEWIAEDRQKLSGGAA